MGTKLEQRYGTGKPRGQKKRWWKKFLTPGWVLTTVFVVIFSYFAFTALAPWQLNKNDAIIDRNDQITASYENDPVPVTDVMNDEGAIAQDEEWTRVTLQGRYVPEDEVLLRMRPVDSSPAFQSLIPFELTNGQMILVHRGWEASGDGTTVPEIEDPPTTTVSVQGMVRQGEEQATRAPLEESGYQQVYSINTPQISELTGTELSEDYVMLEEDSPGALREMPVPKLDRGSHLSYGLQWLAFGVMAPLGLIYLVWAEFKERRRVREERAELGDEDSVETVEIDDEYETTIDGRKTSLGDGYVVERSRSARDRYGDAKPDYYARLSKRQQERF